LISGNPGSDLIGLTEQCPDFCLTTYSVIPEIQQIPIPVSTNPPQYVRGTADYAFFLKISTKTLFGHSLRLRPPLYVFKPVVMTVAEV